MWRSISQMVMSSELTCLSAILASEFVANKNRSGMREAREARKSAFLAELYYT